MRKGTGLGECAWEPWGSCGGGGCEPCEGPGLAGLSSDLIGGMCICVVYVTVHCLCLCCTCMRIGLWVLM